MSIMNKMNKKNLITTIISVVAIAIIVAVYIILAKPFAPNSDGSIQVVLVDLDGTIVSEKEISFKKNDTLEKLLKENYDNVVIEDGMLMSIDNFTTPSDWSSYISIYVNEKMSEVGVLGIEFTDGTKISFIMVEYHE